MLAKQAADLQCATLNQIIVRRVVEAEYEAMIARATMTYRCRRDAMLAALARHMPDGVTWTRPASGMVVWMAWPGRIDSQRLLADALEAGIAFVPGPAFFSDLRRSSALRLSHSLAPEAAIEDGVGRLGVPLRRALQRGEVS